MAEVRDGLTRVMADTPLRSGYLEAMAGATLLGGPFVRAETGAHFLPGLSAYGFAEWNRTDPMVGVGLRGVFDW